MARRAVPRAARVRGVEPQLDAAAAAPRAAARAARAGGRVLRAPRSGRRTAGAPVRDYLDERGLGEDVCREFRLGLALGRPRAKGAAEAASPTTSCSRPGSSTARGNDWFPDGRLVFPLADSRGRVLGFGARRLRDDDPLRAKYVNSPEGELFHKSDDRLRARPLEGRDREAGPRAGRRGLHRRARPAPGGIRAGRGLDGDGADRTPAEGAAAAHAPPLPLLRRRRGRRGGDPARDGARGGPGLRRRRAQPPAGKDPAEVPELFDDEALKRAVPYQVHRVQLAIDRAPSREEALEQARAVLARFDQNTRWLDAVRHVAGRLDLPEEVVRTLPRAVATRRGRAGAARVRAGSAARARGARRLRVPPRAEAAARRALARALREPGPARAPHPRPRGDERRGSGGQRAARSGRGDPARRRSDQDRPPSPPRAHPARQDARSDRSEVRELHDQLRRIREAIDELAEHGSALDGRYNAAARSPVAQLAEHPAVNRRVVGSSPTRGASDLAATRTPHVERDT